MEIQLQELIDQIKNDGVKAAESQSEAILASAKAEAEKIIADAKAEAEKIIANAQSENARIEISAEDAIRQAGRNLLISFRESVARELNVILAQIVSAVYSSENLANIVINVVESWA
ncbi:MAG: V-type ATP synthase subunit E, partial [Clostridia bacterium]|nr:V-type ATP synthase subunit E [Clostridia bacterium]